MSEIEDLRRQIETLNYFTEAHPNSEYCFLITKTINELKVVVGIVDVRQKRIKLIRSNLFDNLYALFRVKFLVILDPTEWINTLTVAGIESKQTKQWIESFSVVN